MYVEINNVSKCIKGDTVLNEVSISFDEGKIYGLYGKNGSGKTMLMRAICGLLHPTSGEVIVDGEKLGKDREFPESVGALIENPGFLDQFSGYKNIKMLTDIKKQVGKKEILQVLKEVGLKDNMNKKYRKYSLGMKKKLALAAAIVENPKLILLDEPMNALDRASIEKVKEIILKRREEGSLIIISSHDIEELEMLADEMIMLDHGQVVSTPNETKVGNDN